MRLEVARARMPQFEISGRHRPRPSLGTRVTPAFSKLLTSQSNPSGVCHVSSGAIGNMVEGTYRAHYETAARTTKKMCRSIILLSHVVVPCAS
jgi:hypothetical protein